MKIKRTRQVTWASLALLAVLTLVAAWNGRQAVMSYLGGWLVAHDRLEPADIMVVSCSGLLAGAFEASRLYRDGMSSAVVIMSQYPQPQGDDIRALGIPYLEPTQMAMEILERSGVP